MKFNHIQKVAELLVTFSVANVELPQAMRAFAWGWYESHEKGDPIKRGQSEGEVFTRVRAALEGKLAETDAVSVFSSMNRVFDWYDRTRLGSDSVISFLIDRLKVQQREAGIRPDIIDAIFGLGGEDDLVRLLARVRALQAFVATDDGTNLLAGYKRAANILRIEEAKDGPHDGAVDPALMTESAERALSAALDTALPVAAAAVEAEDFEAAMSALATLRAPVDGFFEAVMVNAPEPAVRANRLRLLASFRAAVHTVADFSKIEG